MKTYNEVILRAANHAFSNYMGGSYQIWSDVDFDLIAFIYDKKVKTVEADCTKAYTAQSDAYYDSRKK